MQDSMAAKDGLNTTYTSTDDACAQMAGMHSVSQDANEIRQIQLAPGWQEVQSLTVVGVVLDVAQRL
jgi:hypothetical protein